MKTITYDTKRLICGRFIKGERSFHALAIAFGITFEDVRTILDKHLPDTERGTFIAEKSRQNLAHARAKLAEKRAAEGMSDKTLERLVEMAYWFHEGLSDAEVAAKTGSTKSAVATFSRNYREELQLVMARLERYEAA